MILVKALVAVHDCHEVFGIRQVDDVVGIAGEHVHCLDLIATYFKLYDFIRTELTLLDLAVTSHNDEELPLGVVPVFALVMPVWRC